MISIPYRITLGCSPRPRRGLGLTKKQEICRAREIAQELECNFNTSGETVIHPDDIARMTSKSFIQES